MDGTGGREVVLAESVRRAAYFAFARFGWYWSANRFDTVDRLVVCNGRRRKSAALSARHFIFHSVWCGCFLSSVVGVSSNSSSTDNTALDDGWASEIEREIHSQPRVGEASHGRLRARGAPRIDTSRFDSRRVASRPCAGGCGACRKHVGYAARDTTRGLMTALKMAKEGYFSIDSLDRDYASRRVARSFYP